ncbi:MAG: hypothetical protein D6732_17610 [Methanobacteriota archaeon]|nr:MAG: hypothetical protein D6732_17610 [Euryarchaeota archaeon]
MDEQVLRNLSLYLKQIGLSISHIKNDCAFVVVDNEVVRIQMLHGGGYIVDDNEKTFFICKMNHDLVEQIASRNYCRFDGGDSVYCYAADLSSLSDIINNVVRSVKSARATMAVSAAA